MYDLQCRNNKQLNKVSQFNKFALIFYQNNCYFSLWKIIKEKFLLNTQAKLHSSFVLIRIFAKSAFAIMASLPFYKPEQFLKLSV
jgi:hypothetical protein